MLEIKCFSLLFIFFAFEGKMKKNTENKFLTSKWLFLGQFTGRNTQHTSKEQENSQPFVK